MIERVAFDCGDIKLEGVKHIPDTKEYKIVNGADHFWWGKEEEVADEVANFLIKSVNNI